MHLRTHSFDLGFSVCTLLLVASAGLAQTRSAGAAAAPATAPARAPQTRPFTPDDHVITASVSRRANTVLANLIQECRIVNGQWDRHQGDAGCAELFSALFGYRSGLRRGRDDLVAIGRASADNEFNKLVVAAGTVLTTGKGPDMDDLVGLTALMVSGTAGGNKNHYALFVTLLDWSLANLDDRRYHSVEHTGAVYVLAEIYRFDPRHKPAWIKRARSLAGRLDQGSGIPCFGAFAWAAIARASGADADLQRARQIALRLAPRFTRTAGVLQFDGPYGDVLSFHLTLAEAMADLATIEPEGPWYRMGMELAEYVFSDAYFNGKFVAHDRGGGRQAPTFCTGCNYHALYIADRMYGDALKFDPVPPLRVIRAPLRIIKAQYGVGDQWLDVTQAVVGKIRGDRLELRVSNEIGGDPAKGSRKELRIEYEFQGQRNNKSVPEDEWLSLP